MQPHRKEHSVCIIFLKLGCTVALSTMSNDAQVVVVVIIIISIIIIIIIIIIISIVILIIIIVGI